MEEEEEVDLIDVIYHGHKLIWIPSAVDERFRPWCLFCGRDILEGEAYYRCSQECQFTLHEDCAGMPKQIWHPIHPSHPLNQRFAWGEMCVVCEGQLNFMGYSCSSGCDLWVHLECTEGALQEAAEEQVMKHPSHPQHEMRLLRRKKRSCSFECDACGTIEKGNSYICSICQYWIHESCAALPTTAEFYHLHHHSLSLAFQLPNEYYKERYTCGVCDGGFRLRRWAYHCKLCRYAVHIKCATSASLASPSTS